MGEIFHRATLISGTDTKKKEKNRKRNIILNFRVTAEEKQIIQNRILISGLPRGKFFIDSCLHQKIICYGNVKTFEEINRRLNIIENHLLKINNADELDIEILESLRTILELFENLNNEK